MTQHHYRQLVRASAVYDLLVTWPFAVPGLAAHNVELLRRLHDHLGWGGAFPAFEPLHLLFANLMGCVVVAWSLLRLLSPEARFGLVDGLTRVAFSACFIWYLLVWQATGVLYLFVVPEVLWAVAQLAFYRRRFD